MFWLMKFICNAWFILTGVVVKNYNRDKIIFEESFIITPNHQSFVDAAIIYTSIPQIFKSLGKIELEKTPIYGIIYKTVVITVDRSSLRARALSVKKMQEEMSKGISIAIFPEGTFPDIPQNELLPFQNGAFSLAIMQKKSILPILFLDAANRVHPSKIYISKPGKNRIVFLPPIECSELLKEDTIQLRNYTQAYMQECLDYCRSNTCKDSWEFALNWKAQNPFSQTLNS